MKVKIIHHTLRAMKARCEASEPGCKSASIEGIFTQSNLNGTFTEFNRFSLMPLINPRFNSAKTSTGTTDSMSASFKTYMNATVHYSF
jgi:hypothetical protein